MFHSSYQPKFYLIFPQVSFQHFNHSYFAAQDFAEQLFCKTSFTDCVWFIWLPFRWFRTGIHILITNKYTLGKWRSYFSCIFFIFFWAYQRQARSYLMTTNYSLPTNYISSSKDNVFEKHAASVKSLKLEAPVEINTSCWKYKTWVRGSICVIFSYPLR